MAGYSSSSGSSSSTPKSIDSPQSDWGLQLSQMLGALAQNQYGWAMDQFNKGQGITDQNIQQYMDLAGKGAGMAQDLLGRYQNIFEPLMSQYVQQAGDYNSQARQQFMAGKAESTVAQGDKAAMDSAQRQLQGFGINPNSGRYQDLMLTQRTQDAAARAGAGTEASVNTANIGRQMTQQAAQFGQNLPGMTVNALQSAYTGLGGAQNAELGLLNTGANLTNSAANFANASANANKLPPVGNFAQSGQSAHSQQSDPQKQQQQQKDPQQKQQKDPQQKQQKDPSEKGNGNGNGNGGPQKIGGGPGQETPPPVQPDNPWDPTGGNQNPDLSQNGGWGSDPSLGIPDNQLGGSGWNDPTGGDQSPGGEYNPSSFDQQNQDGMFPQDQSQGNYGGMSGDYGNAYSADNSLGSGVDNSSGNSQSSGDYGGYAQGGKVQGMLPSPTTGGPVPRGASPTQGQQTDDVPARLNAGEFVIPRDVTQHFGTKHFQDLIAKSRKLRTGMAGPPAQPKMRPPLGQQPTFSSQPMMGQ
jgi:hypothetical protein